MPSEACSILFMQPPKNGYKQPITHAIHISSGMSHTCYLLSTQIGRIVDELDEKSAFFPLHRVECGVDKRGGRSQPTPLSTCTTVHSRVPSSATSYVERYYLTHSRRHQGRIYHPSSPGSRSGLPAVILVVMRVFPLYFFPKIYILNMFAHASRNF
jgi:hypothetical protein